MSYPEKQLNSYVLLVDAQGSATDDVAAPDAGQTLLYTTEQGLSAERAAVVGEVRQWFLDQPTLLAAASPVSLTDSAQSLLDAPYTIPSDIDSTYPTLYRIEVQVEVNNFVPNATSTAIAVQAYVDGSTATPAVLLPCDAALGIGGGCATFFVTGGSGDDIDVRAYLFDAGDAADATLSIGVLKRELRIS